jgi:hypothetical protein
LSVCATQHPLASGSSRRSRYTHIHRHTLRLYSMVGMADCRRRRNGMRAAALAMVWLASTATAQECACQPSSYTMTLNLAGTCPDATIAGTAGVSEAGCIVESGGLVIEDQVPVSIVNVSIVELDQILEPIQEETILEGPLADGESFEFTRVLGTLANGTIPRVFQVRLFGENAQGDLISNLNVIVFNNDCSVYPVLTEGMQTGWIVFVSV